jgi:hypothetical protein
VPKKTGPSGIGPILCVFAAALIASPVAADEKPIELKKAPGLDKVEANCAASAWTRFK